MRAPRGLMGLLSGFRPGKAGQPREAVPASWNRYAQLTGGIVATWLDESTPAAARLRDRLDDLVGERGDEIQLPLDLWVAPDGTVGRIALPTSVALEVGAAAEAVFEGRRLSAPPSDLPLPLRLQLRISPVGGRRTGQAA